MEVEGTVVAAIHMSPSVKRLTLRLCEPMVFTPGQWVNLVTEHEGEPIRRSYSIASSSSGPQTELEFAITQVEDGPMSTILCGAQLGDSFTVHGPHGFFTRERADAALPWLFVGTGTGVTPLRSMILTELAERPKGPPLLLLFGCRTPEDRLFGEEFESLAARHRRFSYVTSLSRESVPTFRQGYVQTHLADVLAPIPTAHVFICGLSLMIREVRKTLKEELGFTRQRIHSERYD